MGVERRKGGRSRRSYATWEENWVVPTLVLEMVSHKPGGEYGEKMAIYAKLGVLYYVIYNPEFWRRDRHQPLEAYQLSEGQYQLQFSTDQTNTPYWLATVGLGIGFCRQSLGGIEQEILAWYDAQGQAYPLPGEAERQRAEQEYQRAEQEHQRAEVERQRAAQLAAYLRSLGIDPDHLPSA
ncbi:Uma2 family endonuclease [Trichothermofontia sp.]